MLEEEDSVAELIDNIVYIAAPGYAGSANKVSYVRNKKCNVSNLHGRLQLSQL